MSRVGTRRATLYKPVVKNGLLNNLISYWPGNEASGNLQDAHINALHLTDNQTVTNAAGKVYATARQYTAAFTEFHTMAHNALLGASNDFTLAAWCYLDTLPTYAHIAARWTSGTGESYLLRYNGGATDRFYFEVRNAANNAYGNVTANAFGAVSTGTWYFVIAWHDDQNNQLCISVNNGTPDVTSWANGVFNGTSAFQVGSQIASGANFWNGRIGPVAFWKSAAAGGGVLTAAQRTALYNSGDGLAYSAFTA